MINPTLQEVKNQGFKVGLSPKKSEEWFWYYKAQGFKFGNRLEIVDLQAALVRWRNNGYKFEKGDGVKLTSKGRCSKCGGEATEMISGKRYCKLCWPKL